MADAGKTKAGKTKEQLIAESWARWLEADFTWAGLAEKEWQGWVVCADGLVREADSGAVYGQPIPEAPAPATGSKATLQDYWRADPATGRWRDDPAMGEELITAEGQPTYHRVHLPLIYADEAPTGKQDWPDDALDAVIRPRLMAAGETAWEGEWNDREMIGPDRSARLDGGVLLAFDAERLAPTIEGKPRLSLACKNAIFVGDCSFSDAVVSGDAQFEGATFTGDAWFVGATFTDDAWFEGATFTGDAWFEDATFTGVAWFARATFTGAARFGGATFTGVALFEGATFTGDAGFGYATFTGDARFEGATFTGDAGFLRATFTGEAGFFHAAFCKKVALRAAFFAATLDMRGLGAETQRAPAGDSGPAAIAYRAFPSIDAADAVFAGDVDFSDRDILEPSSFRNARFYGLAAFHESALHQGVSFFGARFEDALRETDALPTVPEASLAQMHKAENRMRRIRGESEQTLAEFCSAYDEKRRTKAKRRRENELENAHNAARSADRAGVPETLAAWKAGPQTVANQRFEALEACYRTLKLAMEDNRNKIEEGQFFRLELLARRQRRDKGVPAWERWFSRGYERFSDFGNSIWRPFWRIFALIGLYGVVYWLLANQGLEGLVKSLQAIADAPVSEAAWTPFLQALSFSAGQVIPFGPWGSPPADSLLAKTLAGPAPGFGIRVLATLQSLFAIVLAFLFGLAVRRRFQIS
jgi:uncharacterized protein YjbI with pentapeptide repeats